MRKLRKVASEAASNEWKKLVQSLERRWQREKYEKCLKKGLR